MSITPLLEKAYLMCAVFVGNKPDHFESRTRRLRLNGQSTSIRLEQIFWSILDGMSEKAQMTTPAYLSRLHSEALESSGEMGNFASMLRCICAVYLTEVSVSDGVAAEQ